MKLLKRYAYRYSMVLLGNLFVAIGTVFFVVPGGFITGGATGLALALEAFFSLPLSVGVAIVSGLLFLIGFLFLGRDFAISTLMSTVCYPFFVWLCEQLSARTAFTTDSIALNLAGAVLFYAYGMALVMRQGASTGGLDTIAMILERYRGLSAAAMISVLELASLIPQLAYSTTEGIMGGALVTVIYTAVLNSLLAKDIARIQVQVYSAKYEEISQVILDKFERGCTLFHVQGGYTKTDTYALQTIISNRELFSLKEHIRRIDPKAFMTVSRVSEVSGLGFTYDEEE